MRKTSLLAGLIMFCIIGNLNAQTCSVLKVSGSNQWKPIAFADETKKRALGVSYDVVRLLGAKLNIPVEINVKLPWARALLMLDDGELDVLAGVYWTQERAKKYHYTHSFAKDSINIFVMKGKEFPYEKFDDLIGKKADQVRESSNGAAFDAFAKKHLRLNQINTFKQQFQRLAVGRTDYVIVDRYTAASILRELKLTTKIVMLPNPLVVNNVHFIFLKKSPCAILIPKIDTI